MSPKISLSPSWLFTSIIILIITTATTVYQAPEQLLAPEDTGGPDTFGYTFKDSNEGDGPVYDWVDISSTGTTITLGDDSRHGPFSTGFTFNFYGTDYTDVWVGSEGWLSIGSSDPGNNDNSNDCPLPSQNGNENVIGGIWDNLNATITTPNGLGYYQTFGPGSCPYNGYGEACFVAQWETYFFTFPPDPPFDDVAFEIILLDDNDIVVQIADAGNTGGATSTTGLENNLATDGLTYACNQAGSLSDNLAIQFYYPEFLARFDYSYKTGPAISDPDDNIAYTLVISNSGNISSTNTIITDSIPVGTNYVNNSVSCVGGMGSCFYDSGEDEIGWSGGIDAGEAITISFEVNPNGVCGDLIHNQAVIMDPDAAASPILIPYTTVLADQFTLFDFEADNGGFSGTNDWEHGVPTWPVGLHAHSGDRLWATVLDGLFSDNTTSQLTKTVNLAGYFDNAQLVWWQYIKTGNSLFDIGTLSLNGNEVYNSTGADETAWTQHIVSLEPYVGSNLNLEFNFDTSLSVNNDGWYIDDVAAYYCEPSPTPNLDLSTKTAFPIAVTGEEFAYTITIDNFSVAAATNTLLIDPIPTGTTYVMGSATNGAIFNSILNRIEWTGTIPANDEVDVSFRVVANASPGTTITNTATIDQASLAQPVVVEDTTEVVTASAGTYPSCADFETGSFPAYMYSQVTMNGGAVGRVEVTDDYPHSGTFGLNLDTDNSQGAGTTTQAAILVFNLTGAADVELNFWIRGHDDENHPEDGVFISDDGGRTFAKIYDPPADDWTAYENVFLNLSDAAAAANMSLTDLFLIKFQSRDNLPIQNEPLTSDGYSFDDICLQAPVAAVHLTPGDFSSSQLNNVIVTDTLTINNVGTTEINWSISEAPADCNAPSDLSWMSVTPDSGTVNAPNSAAVTLQFDSTGIPLGEVRTGSLCFNSNDADEPVIQIPLTLTVTSPPDLVVSTTVLSATMVPNDSLTVSFDITNQGFTEMDWYILEDPTFLARSQNGGGEHMIIGTNWQSNQLVAFDTALSLPILSLGSLGTTDYFAADMLPGDPINLYALSTNNRFVKIDVGTAAAADIGEAPLPSGFAWTGLTVHPTTGVIYASATNCQTLSILYTIALETGTPTQIGGITGAPCVKDIAINSAGTMYGIDVLGNILVQINKDTGAGTLVGDIGYNANALLDHGLDFDDATGTLYLTTIQSTSTSQFRSVNVLTGATALIGNLGTSNRIGALSVVSYAECSPGNMGWASANPLNGSVAGNSSVTVDVTFLTNGLSNGTYEGTLCLFSNDPAMPFLPISLTLIVDDTLDDTFIYLPLIIKQ